jgi:hypothetical protein
VQKHFTIRKTASDTPRFREGNLRLLRVPKLVFGLLQGDVEYGTHIGQQNLHQAAQATQQAVLAASQGVQQAIEAANQAGLLSGQQAARETRKGSRSLS